MPYEKRDPFFTLQETKFLLVLGVSRRLNAWQRAAPAGILRAGLAAFRSLVPMTDVTRILSAIEQGDPQAASLLLPLVYDQLRKLAAQKLAQEKPGQTLQATALVHEAYLRLVGSDQDKSWDSRGHFFAAAAEAMRRILVDQARRRRRPKHGGGRNRVSLDEALCLDQAPDDDLLALDEALEKLAHAEPAKAELVKLHYFAGMSLEEAGQALGISHRTAKRHWAYARLAVRGRPGCFALVRRLIFSWPP